MQGGAMTSAPGWWMVAGYALVFFLADFFALFCVSGEHTAIALMHARCGRAVQLFAATGRGGGGDFMC